MKKLNGYITEKQINETIKKVKISNMENNKGNKIANQFEIRTTDGTYFQSYDSLIAFIGIDKVYLDRNMWDYSNTTSKYRNLFLGETKKETEAKIKNGKYILTDLNGGL